MNEPRLDNARPANLLRRRYTRASSLAVNNPRGLRLYACCPARHVFRPPILIQGDVAGRPYRRRDRRGRSASSIGGPRTSLRVSTSSRPAPRLGAAPALRTPSRTWKSLLHRTCMKALRRALRSFPTCGSRHARLPTGVRRHAGGRARAAELAALHQGLLSSPSGSTECRRFLDYLDRRAQREHAHRLHERQRLLPRRNGLFAKADVRAVDPRPHARPPPRSIPAARSTRAHALNVDVAPTFLDAGGAPAPMQDAAGCRLPRAALWRKDFLYEYFEFPAASCASIAGFGRTAGSSSTGTIPKRGSYDLVRPGETATLPAAQLPAGGSSTAWPSFARTGHVDPPGTCRRSQSRSPLRWLDSGTR